MPIGEKLIQGYPSLTNLPPITDEMREKYKFYRASAEKQGLKPLAFDMWRLAGEPAVPALAQELPPTAHETKEKNTVRIDALGNIIDPVNKTVIMADTGENILLDEYVNQIQSELDATDDEIDRAGLTQMLIDVGIEPVAKPVTDASPTSEDITENEVSSEDLRDLAEKYKTTFSTKDLDLLVETAKSLLSQNEDMGLNYTSIQALLDAAESLPDVETKRTLSEAEVSGLRNALQAKGLNPDDPAVWAEAEKLYKTDQYTYKSLADVLGDEDTVEDTGETKWETWDAGGGNMMGAFITRDKSGNIIGTSGQANVTPETPWFERSAYSEMGIGVGDLLSQDRDATDIDTLITQGTPTWLRNFMSDEEYRQEAANTESYSNWYNQYMAKNPALFVGQATPTEIAYNTDEIGLGYNQQWTDDAYNGLIRNLNMAQLNPVEYDSNTGKYSTLSLDTPQTRDQFARLVATQGIGNALESFYTKYGYYNKYPRAQSGGTSPPATPWWSKQYILSAQDYNRLSQLEQKSYNKYLGLTGREWKPAVGQIGTSGRSMAPVFQRG